MKGIVFNIQKYSIQDGPGIRTIVFLKGCPLRCKWCSNPESGIPQIQMMFQKKLCINCGACIDACPEKAISEDLKYGKIIDRALCTHCGICERYCPAEALKQAGMEMSIEEVVSEVEKDQIFYRKTGGGVTLSGGEPLMQAEFAAGLLNMLKENRISTAIETAGHVSFEVYEKCLDDVDLFLYDIKHMDPKVHEEYTKASNDRILDNLRRLNERGKRIWIRVPLIPNVNDSYENIHKTFALARELPSVDRIELLPYHNYGAGKYDQLGMEYELKEMKTPQKERVEAMMGRIRKEFPEVENVIRYH